ncbi:MAG: hypothetical protein QHH10_07340 [Peptococcaceae bacterium]|jgi:hypothetical protein|nr:hypothetical protein [Peptococcaceae bacterium]MDH7525113.1 hypothetical protein [Peptococcaceae bacterium]
MSWKQYKHLYFWLFLAAGLSFFAFYRYMTALPQEDKGRGQVAALPVRSNVIGPGTAVYIKDEYSLCRKFELSCGDESLLEGAARAELNNLSEDELKIKYPQEAGWEVSWQGSKVVLRQIKPGLCPLHRKRWHLAPDGTGEKIAVYLGPSRVGTEGGIVQETGIRIVDLPAELQEKIKNSAFEFIDWDELVATLDSLDE